MLVRHGEKALIFRQIDKAEVWNAALFESQNIAWSSEFEIHFSNVEAIVAVAQCLQAGRRSLA